MVEITIRLNRKLNYKNRSTNTTFFICLVSGAIGSANALCPLGGFPLFGKRRDWLCQCALSPR